MVSTTTETIRLHHCDLEAKVKVSGSGKPIVYLHTATGPVPDPFVDALAQHYTVYAPDHPGTGATAREAIYAIRTLWDLVLIYDELLSALKLENVSVVGASFGGMMACEIAAHRPDRIAKMVLVDPIGLWRDDRPVTPYMMLSPQEVGAVLFSDPASELAQKFFTLPSDPQEAATVIADSVWAIGCTGKFVWPIPDKGLDRRLHRVTADTLIVWGENDKLVSADYAAEFQTRIGRSRVQIIRVAGHLPQWEQLPAVRDLVLGFL
jgi:pimeloyl-ACP methyl ester carboxylesterase